MKKQMKQNKKSQMQTHTTIHKITNRIRKSHEVVERIDY